MWAKILSTLRQNNVNKINHEIKQVHVSFGVYRFYVHQGGMKKIDMTEDIFACITHPAILKGEMVWRLKI